MKPLFLLLCAALPLGADIRPEPMPHPGLQATQGGQDRVEMTSEEVSLTLTPEGLKVEAVFHMRNSGKEDVHLQVGFPMESRLLS